MEILFQKKKKKGKDIFLLTYTIILRNISEGRAYIFKEKKKRNFFPFDEWIHLFIGHWSFQERKETLVIDHRFLSNVWKDRAG